MVMKSLTTYDSNLLSTSMGITWTEEWPNVIQLEHFMMLIIMYLFASISLRIIYQ